MKLFLAFIGAALVTGPALARDPVVKDDVAYRTKKICRVETTTGSRLDGVRICRTRAEWDEIKLQGRGTVERIQGSSSACLRGGMCGG